MKQNQQEAKLQIPLADFLKHNDHGLLEMSGELPHWNDFLDFIAYLANSSEIQTRGSCIALAVLRELGQLEPANGDLEIKHTFVPYTTLVEYLKFQKPYLPELNPEELQLYEAVLSAGGKKNIDIYLCFDTAEEVKETSQLLAQSFVELRKVRVGAFRVLPNQIAALTVEVKGGYVDHEVVLALKPPLKRDLRRTSSARQIAARGLLRKTSQGWIVEISEEDVATLQETDSFDFLEQELPLSEALLHVARSLRFNALYPSDNSQLGLEIERTSKIVINLTKSTQNALDSEVDKYILQQVMNEMMVAFLHNPELILSFIRLLPENLFPHINREAIEKNQPAILAILDNPVEHFFSKPRHNHVPLSELVSLLTSTKACDMLETPIAVQYKHTLDSLDEKLRMTEILEQHDTHSTWYFSEYTDFYLLQLLFQPLAIV